MHRFFVEPNQISDAEIRITGEDVHHINRVLRMKEGEQVLISCGDEWEYKCALSEFSEDMICARILDRQKPGKELPNRITLFQCLPKSDKMELIIQKAVELGVYAVVPVESSRCVVKLDKKKAASKTGRWNSIAEGAAKQSKRMIVPEVKAPVSFAEALAMASDMGDRLIPYENAEGMKGTRERIARIRPGSEIAVLIGPEGGFSEVEVENAVAAGFTSITLGKRILRTETAGLAILSVLMFQLEAEDDTD